MVKVAKGLPQTVDSRKRQILERFMRLAQKQHTQQSVSKCKLRGLLCVPTYVRVWPEAFRYKGIKRDIDSRQS